MLTGSPKGPTPDTLIRLIPSFRWYRVSRRAANSPKIPRLELDLIDVAISIVDVARLRPLRRASRIDTRTPVMEFVAAPVRQRECRVAPADAYQFLRQVRQPMGDKMHDLALALDVARDGEVAVDPHGQGHNVPPGSGRRP